MTRTCVIGWPIAHSRSPLIHNYWIKLHGLNGVYEAMAVEPNSLRQFFEQLRRNEIAGCNVTMPHKENVGLYLDVVSPPALAAGSVNTIYKEGNLLVGTSTDAEGFIANIEAEASDFHWSHSEVLLLGAGGSARAIISGMLAKSVGTIYVWNRTFARAESLSSKFGARVKPVGLHELSFIASKLSLVVNTIPPGAGYNPAGLLDFGALGRSAIIADIVYVPRITPFLAEARRHKLHCVPGLGMLLHQAVGGFEKWYGLRPQVTDELYQIVAADIDREYAA